MVKHVITLEVEIDENDEMAQNDLEDHFGLCDVITGLLNDFREPGCAKGRVRTKLDDGNWTSWMNAKG